MDWFMQAVSEVGIFRVVVTVGIGALLVYAFVGQGVSKHGSNSSSNSSESEGGE